MTVTSTIGRRGRKPADPPERRLFNVDEYYRMAEAGILHPDERVELLEGEIIRMAAIGSRHARCVRFLTTWFVQQFGTDRLLVSTQSPVRLSDRSEPEPDLAILKPRADEYADGHPGPNDVLLLVEVSETTLRYDRDTKLPIYAAAGIAEVWIVNLEGRQVEVFRQPEGRRYRETSTFSAGQSLSPLAFPESRLPVEQVLGPART